MGLNNPYALKLYNGRVTVPNSDSLNPKRQITIEYQCYINSFMNTWMPIIWKGTGRQYSIWQNSNGLIYVGTKNSSTNAEEILWNASLANPLVLKTKYHIAVTINRDTGSIKVYKNGILWNSGAIASGVDIGIVAESLLIGATNESNTAYSPFDGTIDEIRIWNIERTADQIKANYNKKVEPIVESNLIAYYRCDEGSGTTLIDLTSNGNNGVITNGYFVTDTVDLANYFEVVDYDINSVYLWELNNTSLSITLKLNGLYGNNFNYRVINEKFIELVPMQSIVNSPTSLTVSVNLSSLVLGNNYVIVEATNESSNKYYFGAFLIAKENRDTATFTRQFKDKSAWDLSTNGSIINGQMSLITNGENIFKTTENSTIYTKGKRKINYIHIDGDDDIIKDSTFIENCTTPIQTSDGYIQEYDLRMNRFLKLKSIDEIY
jgi:hypothetical protein